MSVRQLISPSPRTIWTLILYGFKYIICESDERMGATISDAYSLVS